MGLDWMIKSVSLQDSYKNRFGNEVTVQCQKKSYKLIFESPLGRKLRKSSS